ncbi:arsenite efflux ATP-binding protein ArsA [Knoellia remsis]|uniref:Arsenite efflux ATP-binding protein ArsA n=1 Tax=Knoellia remsis TaxID=407159 RepID=A0A2T0UNF1_9MICO|nr:ArsA-related P-loop ATPase [Knoellia remsis]PRY59459.1 arsenite efflux ATP-binding protein ArsA [Knoellia remsis]
MPQPPLADLTGARLHVVTGKGGVGKTTVAAALALALTSTGKRVLLVEVEGRQGLSQTFDVPPLGTDETRLVAHPSGGELWGLSVDAKAALLEYLQLFYKLGRAGGALEKVGAIDFATTIAPGVRDVLLIGKVYEAVGRPKGGRGSRGSGAPTEQLYDAVVLDAPPTGRAVRFLNVNAEVAGVAKVGPIKNQADAITRMLKQRSTVVHMVTLLEEMPVQESLDGLRDLEAAGLHLGAIVVNQVREPHLSPEDVAVLATTDDAALDEQLRTELAAAGLRPTNPMVTGLLAEGRAHAQRLALQDDMAAEIADAGPPVVELPALAGGVEDGGIAVLAEELLEQGVR